MITENKLDVRTITMGISLRDCAHPNIDKFCQNVYDKITKSAEFLVKTGEDIETEYGIPIIHKRVSVTPIAIAADACKTDSYVPVAEAMDRAAKEIGINFIGGFSALVEKGFTHGAHQLDSSGPRDDGPRLLLGEPRFDEDGHQHGLRARDGRSRQAHGRAHA